MKWWRVFGDIYIIKDTNHPYLDILTDVLVPCYEEWPWVSLPEYVNDNQPD